MLKNGRDEAHLLLSSTWENPDPIKKLELVREWVGDEVYEYYPLGEYIVAAAGVCGGRPTFKYTRIEATGALSLIAAGYTLAQIAQRFAVPQKAVEEALQIAADQLNHWKISA